MPSRPNSRLPSCALAAALLLLTLAGAAQAPPATPATAPAWDVPPEAEQTSPVLAARVRDLERRGAPGELVAALGELGDALLAAHHAAAGIACYRQQLAVCERALGPEHPDTAKSLNDLGVVLWEAQDAAGARSLLERALTLREKVLGAEDRAVAETLFNLGQVVLVQDGDVAAARRMYERALAILEKKLGPDDPEVADALLGCASVSLTGGDFPTARRLAGRVLAIRERAFGEQDTRVADALTAVATISSQAGDFAAARGAAERALAIRTAKLGPDHPDVALSLESVATALLDQGEVAAALGYLRRAVAIREKAQGPRHRELARSLANLATALRDVGDLTGARRFFERALVMHEQLLGPDNPDVAWDLMALASVLADAADYPTARPLFERAAALQERILGPEHPNLGVTLNNLAALQQAQGDLAAARATLERALAIRQKALGSDNPLVASSINNLAVVLKQQGDLAAARPLYERALAIRTRVNGPEHREVATTLHNLASLLAEEGNSAGARRLYEQALAIREKTLGKDHPLVAATLVDLGPLLEQAGEVAGAGAILRRAVSIRERTLGPDHPDRAGALAALAGFEWRQGRERAARRDILRAAGVVDAALARLLPALSLAEQRALLAKLVPEQTSLLLSSHRGGRDLASAYAVLFRWKGLLVESLRREAALIRIARDTASVGAADRLRALRTRIAGLYHRAGAVPVEAWRQELARLTTEKEAVERELARAGAPDLVADRLAAPDLATFRSRLGQDEAFIDIYRHASRVGGRPAEDHYTAVVTGRRSGPLLVDLGPAVAVESAVRVWRHEALEVRQGEAEWQGLAAIVWYPLVPALPRRVARVWLSPDGELARIPWHLLPASHPTTRGLLLTQSDSGREVARLSRLAPVERQGQATLFLAGAIDFGAGAAGERRDDSFQPLPGTEGEVARLGELGERRGLAVALAMGRDADKRHVTAGLASATFVHLATHGFFFREAPGSGRGVGRRSRGDERNPLVESGIALAGANLRDATTQEAKGLLTAEELVGLDLSHCQLVTLSACDTGRGEEVTGQGVMGLRAACLAAGARSMVMSLWTVPDESTAKLMQAFYANLWEKKLPRVEALRRAQESVRDDPSGSFREPIHWAGWALAGEGW